MNRLDKVRYTAKMKVVLPADLALNASGVPIFPIRRRTAKATC
jgi:hypothetical protein